MKLAGDYGIRLKLVGSNEFYCVHACSSEMISLGKAVEFVGATFSNDFVFAFEECIERLFSLLTS